MKLDGIDIEKYNGVPHEEIYKRTLPDIIDHDMDIVFVNLFPSLYSAFVGSHYAGPGNHFWYCLHESGLVNRLLKSSEGSMLIQKKIGLVNMLQKASPKSYHDLSFSEIKSAQDSLVDRLRNFKPKIVAFNGKHIYEIYSGKSLSREFDYGKQNIKFDNGDFESYVYVLPGAEFRCPNYRLMPRAIDKLPFYIGLRKLNDYSNAHIQSLDDTEITFPEFKVDYDGITSEMSDSEDNNTSLLDDSTHESKTRKRSLRTNNVPYKELPSQIIETLVSQRKLKKDIVITTSEKCFQRFFIATKDLSKKVIDINKPDLPVSLCDQASNGAPSLVSGSLSSDHDMTNDSDISVNSIKLPIQPMNESSIVTTLLQQASQVNTKTVSSNLNIVNYVKPTTIKQIQSKPVVLNLSSSSGNPTLKQILSAPYNSSNSLRNITSQTVNLTVQGTSTQSQKPQILHYGQPLKLNTVSQNYKIVNIQPNQTINEKCLPSSSSPLIFQNVKILNEAPASNQVIRKDQNTVIVVNNNTVQNNKPNVKLIAKKGTKHINKILNSSDATNIASPRAITPKTTANATSKSNEDNSPAGEQPIKKIANQAINQTVQNIEPNQLNILNSKSYEASEGTSYIEYELLIEDRYRYSDYYTFNDNTSYLSKKYSDEDNNRILNNIIQLHYSKKNDYDESYELSEKMPVKRHFSEIKEANSVLLNSRETKRQCMIDILNL